MKYIKLFEEFTFEARKSLEDLYTEREELLQDIKDLRQDMENDQEVIDQPDASEPGSKADWYGGEMNKLEDKLEKLDAQIQKAENPNPRTPRAPQPDAKKILDKNIDDAKDSIKKFPQRTEEESAAIFKKRYNMKSSIEEIVSAMVVLGLYPEKK